MKEREFFDHLKVFELHRYNRRYGYEFVISNVRIIEVKKNRTNH